MFNLIINGNTKVKVNQFIFNDGSVNVELIDPPGPEVQHIVVDASIKTPADQMALVMLRGALQNRWPLADCHLVLLFTPYGRQDAVFLPGQVNAMKSWAGLVNSLDFATVTTMDPHSGSVDFFNNLFIIHAEDALLGIRDNSGIDFITGSTLVSPDAGANKKAHKICKALGITEMVRADKARDLQTGDIIETELYGDVKGKCCLIIDDICDGGMTFIKLAEKLKECGASKVILFVTHGLFTKGLSVFEGLIEEIYTTTSWTHEDVEALSEGYTGKFAICDGQTPIDQ